jgi:hypothetical protein
MGLNLSVELFAQNDPVLAISRQPLVLGIARIPDSSFGHEIESRAMNDRRPLRVRIGPEKDGRTEDSLERGDQAAVLRTPCCIPKVLSISAALSNTICGDFCRIACVARKIGTRRSCPHGNP